MRPVIQEIRVAVLHENRADGHRPKITRAETRGDIEVNRNFPLRFVDQRTRQTLEIAGGRGQAEVHRVQLEIADAFLAIQLQQPLGIAIPIRPAPGRIRPEPQAQLHPLLTRRRNDRLEAARKTLRVWLPEITVRIPERTPGAVGGEGRIAAQPALPAIVNLLHLHAQTAPGSNFLQQKFLVDPRIPRTVAPRVAQEQTIAVGLIAPQLPLKMMQHRRPAILAAGIGQQHKRIALAGKTDLPGPGGHRAVTDTFNRPGRRQRRLFQKHQAFARERVFHGEKISREGQVRFVQQHPFVFLHQFVVIVRLIGQCHLGQTQVRRRQHKVFQRVTGRPIAFCAESFNARHRSRRLAGSGDNRGRRAGFKSHFHAPGFREELKAIAQFRLAARGQQHLQ